MRETKRIEALKKTIGRRFGIGLGDVGVWDVDGRLLGGFYDCRLGRARSFEAAEVAPGCFRLHEEGAATPAA